MMILWLHTSELHAAFLVSTCVANMIDVSFLSRAGILVASLVGL